MKKIEIITNVVEGNLKRNRSLIIQALETFEGKTIKLTIEKATKKRSNMQNAFYWGCIIPVLKQAFLNEWGEIWSSERTHEFCKMQFNIDEKINHNTGEILKIPKSTSENTTTSQEEFHEKIRQFAKEYFNVDIPLPNEDLKLEL